MCTDIDECSNTKACARFSKCMNTIGSYKCGACQEGYYGNPYVKCKGIRYCSGDAETNPCDNNAQCISKHFGRSFECVVSRNYYVFLLLEETNLLSTLFSRVLNFAILSKPYFARLYFRDFDR